MSDAISRQAVIDEGMSYINGDCFCDKEDFAKYIEFIEQLPTIQPEIIYCGDGCKFWNRHAGEQAGTCDILRQCTSDSFYCGNAKRSEVPT